MIQIQGFNSLRALFKQQIKDRWATIYVETEMRKRSLIL